MRRGIYVSLLMAVVLLLVGCSKNVDYQPPLDIPAATYVSAYKAKVLEPFRIEDVTDPDIIITSPCQDKIYKADLSAYGKALKATLERELVKNGFQVSVQAEKVIRIDVIDVEMAWPKMPRCDINVVIGIEGQRIGIATNANWSTSIDDAIDAAIADAASRILSNQEVVAYLTNTL